MAASSAERPVSVPMFQFAKRIFVVGANVFSRARTGPGSPRILVAGLRRSPCASLCGDALVLNVFIFLLPSIFEWFSANYQGDCRLTPEPLGRIPEEWHRQSPFRYPAGAPRAGGVGLGSKILAEPLTP
ncbi:unnamed protein product [Parnassius mnemosyne]|uniref:Uncharacterized protein n=1 Tax=Parnassius mnemosyne TaxID=213953 RepID=A0AAV1M0J4_9NEOP